MIKKGIIAITLPCLTALGVIATGQLGSVIGSSGQASLFATIAYDTALKIDQNAFIDTIIKTDILPATQTRDNAFTKSNGLAQTQSVIAEYYKAAWKKFDARQKLDLKSHILGLQPAHSIHIKNMNASFGSMLRHLSIDQIAAVLERIPYELFSQLTIPYAVIAPVITGTFKTSRFLHKTIYKNKLYADLQPVFDLCDQRIEGDWKLWNQKFLKKT